MRLVSFDPFRTLSIPGVRYVTPERYAEHLDELLEADWLLFPPYWQLNVLHFGLRSSMFPSPASYCFGHDKVEMTRVLQAMWPANHPQTLVLANTDSGRSLPPERFGYPFVAKTPRAAEGRGVFLVRDARDWSAYCDIHAVLYAQERLDIHEDLRLVVVGSEVVASYWRRRPEHGFHSNLDAGGELHFAPAPAAAVELVTDIARRLDIDHAGFDVAMVDGQPLVLDFNRLFGNQGLSEQGIRPQELIYLCLRARSRPPRPRSGGGAGRRPRRVA
jgi:ribosomal protein S6--L-glutamate ligase